METIDTVIEGKSKLVDNRKTTREENSADGSRPYVGERPTSQITERGYFELKHLRTYGCQADME